MADIDAYKDKFSDSGKRVLESAFNEMHRREQYIILPEHILYALMGEETELFDSTMRNISIEPNAVRLAVGKRLENISQYTGKGFRIAPETIEIFKFSMDRARAQSRRVIEAGDILYVLTTSKYNLLNDILQNPDAPVRVFNENRIGIEDKQSHFFSQSQATSSSFFTQFSLRELANKNNSPSGLLFPKRKTGGIGGGVSSIGGDSGQTTNIKHGTIFLHIKSEDSNKFDEAEFIASLRKDVEDSINQSRLKITKINSQNSSSFRLEYTKGKIEGQIDFSGEMKNGYYELKAMITEKCGRKTEKSGV